MEKINKELEAEVKETNKILYFLYITVTLLAILLFVKMISRHNNKFNPPKEKQNEVFISLQQQSTHLDSGICLTEETEDGQLVIFDSKRFDRLITQATVYEVRVQQGTFTKSSGEKIPFWIATGIRRK